MLFQKNFAFFGIFRKYFLFLLLLGFDIEKKRKSFIIIYEENARGRKTSGYDMFDITKFKKDNSAMLKAIYGEKTEQMTKRIEEAVKKFVSLYGDGDFSVFSVPAEARYAATTPTTTAAKCSPLR